MPASSKVNTSKQMKASSAVKASDVIEAQNVALRVNVPAAGKLVLALNFTAKSPKALAPFSKYPLNTVIVVPASASNGDYFHESKSFVHVGHVTFSYGESGDHHREDTEESFALLKLIDPSDEERDLDADAERDFDAQIEWSLPPQLETVNHNGQQRLRPEECVQKVSSSVFKLPRDSRRKYLILSLECLIIISNVVADCKKHSRTLTSVTAFPRVANSLSAAVLVVCHTAGGCPCASSLDLPKPDAGKMKPVLEAMAQVKKLAHMQGSKFLLLCSFLSGFPEKNLSADCLSSTGSQTSAQPKLKYDAEIRGVKYAKKIEEGEVVAMVEFELCSPMEDVPNTLPARISTCIGSLQLAIKQLQPEDSPVLYAKKASDESRVDLKIEVKYDRKSRIEGVAVVARRLLKADDERELLIDLIGEPFSLESLASLMTQRKPLTGSLKVIGNLADLCSNKVNKCDLQLTGTVLELLPQLIKEGKRYDLLGDQYNMTYDGIKGKKKPHKMVQIVRLSPEWLQLVIDITAQLNAAYNKANGYDISAQSLLAVLADAGQSVGIKPDLANPTFHYTGPLILYDVDIEKFPGVEEAKEKQLLDKTLYLDTHMDGPKGGSVLTLTFQFTTDETRKATPTVIGERLPGGDLLSHIMEARGEPEKMKKLLQDLHKVLSCKLPEDVPEVVPGAGLVFRVDTGHSSAATLNNYRSRVTFTFQVYCRNPSEPMPLFWERLYGIRDWTRCLPNNKGDMVQFGTWYPIHDPNLLTENQVQKLLEEFGDAHEKYLVHEGEANKEKEAQEKEEVIEVQPRAADEVQSTTTTTTTTTTTSY